MKTRVIDVCDVLHAEYKRQLAATAHIHCGNCKHLGERDDIDTEFYHCVHTKKPCLLPKTLSKTYCGLFEQKESEGRV